MTGEADHWRLERPGLSAPHPGPAPTSLPRMGAHSQGGGGGQGETKSPKNGQKNRVWGWGCLGAGPRHTCSGCPSPAGPRRARKAAPELAARAQRLLPS